MKDPEKLAIKFLLFSLKNGITEESAKHGFDYFKTKPEYEQVPEVADNAILESDAGCPEWLTPELRKRIRDIWDSHKTVDDHLRVDAIRYICDLASVSGYEIRTPKALELFDKYCKNYQL